MVPAEALDIVVAVAIASITINPLTFKAIEPARPLARPAARRGALGLDADGDVRTSSSLAPEGRALVIGYGPTGRTVSRLLRENAIVPTVVDLNLDTVHEIRNAGGSAIYGDARYRRNAGHRRHPPCGHAHPQRLGRRRAGDHPRGARASIRAVHTFVRSGHLRDVAALTQAGAERVFTGEGEVALAMTEAVLRDLGATPDQIERERARAREELFGPADEQPSAAGAGAVAANSPEPVAAAVSACTALATSIVCDTSSTVVPTCTTADPRGASTPPSA